MVFRKPKAFSRFSQVSQHPACSNQSTQTRKTTKYFFNDDIAELAAWSSSELMAKKFFSLNIAKRH